MDEESREAREKEIRDEFFTPEVLAALEKEKKQRAEESERIVAARKKQEKVLDGEVGGNFFKLSDFLQLHFF